SGGLSDVDVKAMIDEAQANEKLDKIRRDEIEARNQAESLVYSTEKSLKEYETKINSEIKSKILTALKAVKDGLTDETINAETLKTRSKQLMELSMTMGQNVYNSKANSQYN
ncbi:MAG: Hsp70 family protein, partial [Candidatus Hodgkinia cicadicola]